MSKVIVVDDDYSTTSLIKMLLELEGYEVSTFTEITSALQAAERGVTAFIIDCYLGKEATGIDLLRSIRRHSDVTVRNAPIIMVSGDERIADHVVSEGADLFLLKPYSPNALTIEMKELIASKA